MSLLIILQKNEREWKILIIEIFDFYISLDRKCRLSFKILSSLIIVSLFISIGGDTTFSIILQILNYRILSYGPFVHDKGLEKRVTS